MHSNRELWYDRPARYWEEALALGNGRLGAMLYSGIKEDLILMNEEEYRHDSAGNQIKSC